MTSEPKAIDTSVLQLVGNTPLMWIPYTACPNVKIFAKLEWYNPSGSVKDRAAAAIILDALAKDKLKGKVLLDASSGNTGIAYAMMCASLGVPLELALPDNASEERKLILKNYGVNLHYTSPLEGTDGAQKVAAHLANTHPDKYYYADQYNNPNNWNAHYMTTGPEIWSQTGEAITHFVTGLGTSGSFVGTSRFLKEKGVHCRAVHPDSPMHGLEGWKHMETALVPGIYDATIADSNTEVGTEVAFQYAKAATEYLGLMLSPSAAANLVAAIELAKEIESGTVVTLFPDNGMKYLRDSFWGDDTYKIENPFR